MIRPTYYRAFSLNQQQNGMRALLLYLYYFYLCSALFLARERGRIEVYRVILRASSTGSDIPIDDDDI